MISVALVAQAPERVKPPKQGIHEYKLGVNVLRSLTTFLGSGRESHEIEGALGVNGFNFVVDLGTEKNLRNEGYLYENKGTYYRAGISRNFVKNVSSGNMLALGLRYVRADFKDELIYTLNNGFGDQNIDLSNPNLQARWIELVFDIRGKIVSQLYTGFSLRWKFSRKINGEGDLKTFDVPGFGNTKRDNATSFDYYIMWRIPFKK